MRGACTCLHLENAGARNKKRKKKIEKAGRAGDKEAVWGGGAKRETKKKGGVDNEEETLSVMYPVLTQQHNTESCFQRKQPHAHTRAQKDKNEPSLSTFLRLKPEI